MARIAGTAKVPKVNESWRLTNGGQSADLLITNVTAHSDFSGGGMKYTLEGYVTAAQMHAKTEHKRQVQDTLKTPLNSNMLTYNTSGHGAWDGKWVAKTSTYPNNGVAWHVGGAGDISIDYTGKGMAVDIKCIETVDGHKAQIVLTVGSKRVIVWESAAHEDDDDLEKGKTGAEKARAEAEAHAKTVLKKVFK